jgi:hypothetical protein
MPESPYRKHCLHTALTAWEHSLCGPSESPMRKPCLVTSESIWVYDYHNITQRNFLSCEKIWGHATCERIQHRAASFSTTKHRNMRPCLSRPTSSTGIGLWQWQALMFREYLDRSTVLLLQLVVATECFWEFLHVLEPDTPIAPLRPSECIATITLTSFQHRVSRNPIL